MTERCTHPTREQFDSLVGPHLDCMLRAARRVLGSDDLAWDAVQETLLRFWTNRRVPDAPRPALLQVLHPVSLQILRSQRRRSHHEAEAAARRPAPDDTCADPACVHERAELCARLAAAIDELPRACGDALRLWVGLDLGYDAIAARLSVPVGTVRSRLARARDLLRRRIRHSEAARRHFEEPAEPGRSGGHSPPAPAQARSAARRRHPFDPPTTLVEIRCSR